MLTDAPHLRSRLPLQSRSLSVALSLLLVAAATAAVPGPTDTPHMTFRLTHEADYQHGCFEPCACPVFGAPLRGTFDLRRTHSDLWFDYYAVTDVNWLATFVDGDKRIIGSGTYMIGGDFALVHRLQLDLRVGDEPVQHFDSGFVVGGGPGFPAFDITVSINGIYCLDTVIRVAAKRVPPAEITPYTLGKHSRYQEGCWNPCDCLLYPEQPVVGGFGLVPLRITPLFEEFAVVGVTWRVLSPAAIPAPPRIHGAGIYRVGGEVAIVHQLQLDLAFGDAPPVRFDSGLIPGGGTFPAINIDISDNGFVCYNRAFYLHAKPVLTPVGDVNCDGGVTFADIDPFVMALGGRDAYEPTLSDCWWLSADCNGDGTVDFKDIDPFVGVLAGH